MTIAPPKKTDRSAMLAARLKRARIKKETQQTTIPRRLASSPLQLSFAQQRLWFLQHWEPDNPTYHISLAFRLTGCLDIVALEDAFNSIILRHQSLHLIYDTVDGEPTLVPHPDPQLQINIIATNENGTQSADPQMAGKLSISPLMQAARLPFNLATDLPIRATLFRETATEHTLLIVMHHIASDAWSLGVLLHELSLCYAATVQDTAVNLPHLPIQYADFSEWQQGQNDTLAQQTTYWQQQLQNTPTVLNLPTDFPRPAVKTTNGAIIPFKLSPELSGAVAQTAQQLGMTPFMLTLATYHLLLQRYTNQDDILVGIPIAGRHRPELESLIGVFINTLVMRFDLSGNPTVRDLLHQVRQVALNAYANQDVPFEKLVDLLQPERQLSHSVLFQAMFNFHNTPESTLILPGLHIRPLLVDNGTTKFDLNMALFAEDGVLQGMLTYNTDLFSPETMHRFIAHYQTLLGSLVFNLDQPISQLEMLTAVENQQLLVEWNQTETTYPATAGLHQLFEQQAARVPDRIAVNCERASLTYRQLNERANQLAHQLRQSGVQPDDCVGLFFDRSLDLMVTILGVLKAGAAYIPLDPIYPADRIQFIVEDAAVSLVLTESSLKTELPIMPHVQLMDIAETWSEIAQHSRQNPPSITTPEHLMYVLFTSGSTGKPKGVAVTHANYINYVHGAIDRIGVEDGWHFAIVSTFAADLGSTNVWCSLCTGGQLHILPYERAVDPEAFAAYFREHHIDAMKLVPSHFEAMRHLPNLADVIPHKCIIFAGEASYWEMLDEVRHHRPEVMIQNHYGPTETTVSMLTFPVPTQPLLTTAVPLGRPIGNVKIYVVDKQMRLVPVGVPGELLIGGPGVARGYLNRPNLTAEKFIENPFGNGRLYRTGDLVRYLPTGDIEFLGRIDHQVKIRGYRVELSGIETLLTQHPLVQDAVVIVREDTPNDKRIVAYLVPHANQTETLSISNLRDDLRAQLPDYMVPTAFVVMDAIPLNPNGKIARDTLPLPDLSARSELETMVAPRTQAEANIAAVWSDILGIETISIDDNFFDLGGESFKAIRAVRQIGATVSVMDLFKNPTIRTLAAHLASGNDQPQGLLHELTPPIAVQQKKLSLVCVPYAGGSAITFQTLAQTLPPDYSLYAVGLPGHDFSRPDEVLRPLHTIAAEIVAEIKTTLSGPIALYGHCLGGALTVKIGQLLQVEKIPFVGVFLGGTFPSARPSGKLYEWVNRYFPLDRLTSNRDYHDFLRALGGFTDIIDHHEREFMLRSLRHDLREAETFYTQEFNKSEADKLTVPITCIVGHADRSTEFYEERYQEWAYFSDQVDLSVIPNAGHYFLKHQADELVDIIEDSAASWQAGVPPVLAEERVETAVQPSMSRFGLVALGQSVSMIGTSLTIFALGIWVYQKTGNMTDFALISLFALLPGILVSPFAGAVVDRWDRRRVMIISDIGAACGTLFVAILFWSGSLQIWHIYLAASIGSIANAFQRPAYAAAITQLVPKRYLGHANGFAQLGLAVGELLAPLLGGFLVISIGLHGIVFIDFATFLISLLTLVVIRFPNMLFHKSEEPFAKEIVGGWQYIIKRPSLVTMVIFFVVFNLFFAIMNVLVTPIILSFASPATLGLVMAASGIGLLVGSLVMSLWGGTKRRAEGMIGFVVLLGFSTIIMGLRPNALLAGVGLFGIWFALSLINAHWQSLMQTKVGLELQGRVISTNQMLAWSMMPVGFYLAGYLVDTVFEPFLSQGTGLTHLLVQIIGADAGRGAALLVVIVGGLLMLWGAIGYVYRPLRYMEDVLPDAVPDGMMTRDKDTLQSWADNQLQLVSEK
ncbi:MAG: amino acid adenylation domain-containing protein [Chloroflexi bacterium]|nr:amino acid adenylation domain-containing protein [Chloroflexota bacterium]